jgi:hypothetical protein
MGTAMDVFLERSEASARGWDGDGLHKGAPPSVPISQVLRPLTPLLAAAAFAVTAMTLVGCLIVG